MRRRERQRPTIQGGPLDGAPREPNTTGLLAVFVVLAVVLGVWLINGRDPGSGSSIGPDREVIGGGATDSVSGLPFIDLAVLPPEAAETLDLIEAGGPFPEEEDGSTFYNREERLPERPEGYYAEYTVPTPGERDRGARRIVAGDGGERYFTADHYQSFAVIRE